MYALKQCQNPLKQRQNKKKNRERVVHVREVRRHPGCLVTLSLPAHLWRPRFLAHPRLPVRLLFPEETGKNLYADEHSQTGLYNS